jgi:CO/xanthine dehydrogenase Mo-binding subunit
VTVQGQIARTELGVETVVVLPADTDVGDAGTSSASRQTWISGGAVQSACAAVRERLLEIATGVFGEPVEMLRLEDGVVVSGLVRVVEIACAQDVERR